MAKFSDHLGLWAFKTVRFSFRLTPFWLLYAYSNFLYLVLYKLLGYRKQVVRDNLLRCFPEKTEAERSQIERQFYSHLCDIFLESLKGLSMSEEVAKKRWKVVNGDILDPIAQKEGAAVLAGAHYNNWEWGGAGFGFQTPMLSMVIYKPMANKLIEAEMFKGRSLSGNVIVPTYETSKQFEAHRLQSPLLVLIADQNPSSVKKAHWVEFFGQQTATIHGPARYAQGYNIPIYYVDVQKVKRGVYEVHFEELIKDPQAHTAEEISQIYMAKVEAQIRKDPAYWLWSHKRWKHKPPQA